MNKKNETKVNSKETNVNSEKDYEEIDLYELICTRCSRAVFVR